MDPDPPLEYVEGSGGYPEELPDDVAYVGTTVLDPEGGMLPPVPELAELEIVAEYVGDGCTEIVG